LVGRGSQHRKDFLNIKQPYISAKHFSIEIVPVEGGDKEKGDKKCMTKFLLADLSVNGTFVNDNSLEKNNTYTLADGDVIGIQFKGELKIAYTFNMVDDVNKAPKIAPQPLWARPKQSSQINGDTSGTGTGQSPEGGAESQKAQIENEEQENRYLCVVAEKDSLTRQLTVAKLALDNAREGSTALDGQVQQLMSRVLDLESHNASLEARCRIQEEQLHTAKSELETQRLKDTVSTENELQIGDLKASIMDLKTNLSRKTTQAETKQRLADKASVALNLEIAARANAEDEVVISNFDD
jgi:hypothetical protein